MDDFQQDALLEELRKLRGEVRSLRHVVFNGIIMLAVITAAVAFEVNWFKESLLGTTIGGSLVWLLWCLYQARRDARDARKQKAPARVVVTTVPPVPKL